MILSVSARLDFELSYDELDENFIDQQTGEVRIDRIADAMDAKLGRRESYGLEVLFATAR